MREWFSANVGSGQECMMSPCLVNVYVYVDGVVRVVNDRVFEQGLELLLANGVRFEINHLFLQMIQH